MSDRLHTDSPFRFCKRHNLYYLVPEQEADHELCVPHSSNEDANQRFATSTEPTTWPLQWREVLYYLNKLRAIKDLFNKLRTELQL